MLLSVICEGGGAAGNNPINSPTPNLPRRINNFFGRNHQIINAGIGALSLSISALAAKFGFDALQLQEAFNVTQEELVRSNRELTESNRELAEANRQLADALNQSNNSKESSGSSYGIFRTIVDLFQAGRFFANRRGRRSGSRDPNDSEFNTPPSGRAHRENRERDR